MNTHKPIILFSAMGVVALSAVACSKPAQDDTSSTTPPAATTTQTTPLSPAGGPGMGASPANPAMNPGAPGAGAPFPGGAKGGIFANKPPAGKPGAQVAAAPPSNRHADPFQPLWKSPNNFTPVFDLVDPIRVASAVVPTPPPPNTEIREIPTRRVSGIMNGDGVYAILEGGNSEPEIVKPGSRTSDGYRVVSISADSVKLQRKEGNYILTQIVPLSDVPVSGVQPAGFRGGPGGFPGRPGFGGPFGPGGPGGAPGFGPGGPGGGGKGEG